MLNELKEFKFLCIIDKMIFKSTVTYSSLNCEYLCNFIFL